MSEATEEQINAAAQWWADQLRDIPKQDNGDALHGAMMSHLSKMVCTKYPISGDQIEVFKTVLVEELLKPENARFQRGMGFGTDYHPDRTLQTALDAAAITHGEDRLPVKTIVFMLDGEVRVRNGYGAPIEVIYPAAH